MAYENLRSAIKAVIKQNGNEEITGEIMQSSLLAMIDSLGAGFQFAGVASTETVPEANDTLRFYLAADTGEYIGFGLKAEKPGIYVISNPDNFWRIDALATEKEVVTVDDTLSETSTNPVQNKVITSKLNELTDKTERPIIEISVSGSTGTVTSHTWDEIRKFIQNEIPVRVLFDGLDIATPLEVRYQDAEDGYYSGVISTADFRREFRIDSSLSVDITDTYKVKTYQVTLGDKSESEDSAAVVYPLTNSTEELLAIYKAVEADPHNSSIVLTLKGESYGFDRTLRFSNFSHFVNNDLTAVSVDEENTNLLVITSTGTNGVLQRYPGYVKREDIPFPLNDSPAMSSFLTGVIVKAYTQLQNGKLISPYDGDEDLIPPADFEACLKFVSEDGAMAFWDNAVSEGTVSMVIIPGLYIMGKRDHGIALIRYRYASKHDMYIQVIPVPSEVDLSGYYTKEETNTKLAEYALKDSVKQSDWNTSDTSDASYIKNKPTKLSQFENDKNFVSGTINESSISIRNSNGMLGQFPISMFFDHAHSANRFAFLPNKNMVFEYTIDGGNTWLHYSGIDGSTFISKGAGIRVRPDSSGKVTTNCGIRVSLTAMNYNIPSDVSGPDVIKYWNSDNVVSFERYFQLLNIIVNVNTSVNNMLVSVDTQQGLAGSDWTNVARNVVVSGSPYLNIINLPQILFGGRVHQTSNVWNLRVTLMTGLGSGQSEISTNLDFMGLSGHGNFIWENSNNYIKTGYIYDYDSGQNVTFPANLAAKNILVDSPKLTDSQSVNVTGESSKLYSGASLTSLTITAAKTDSSQNGAEEVFQFSTGASPAITITGVSWANSDTPTFEANKTYEIHIMYNSTLDKFLATYATYE